MKIIKQKKLHIYLEEYLKRRESNKILIFGNYSGENVGDEAILYTMVNDVRGSDYEFDIYVPSRNPEIVAKRHGVRAVPFRFSQILSALLRTNIIVVGGGTIFSEYAGKFVWLLPFFVTFSRLIGKKVVFYSLGFDPSTPFLLRIAAKFSFLFANKISMRDQASIQYNKFVDKLRGIDLVKDPVFHFDDYIKVKQIDKKQNKIAFALNPVRDPKVNDRLVHEYSKTCKKLIEQNKDIQIVLLSFYMPIDYEFNKRIVQKLSEKEKISVRVERYLEFDQVLKQFEQSKVIVLSRLHSNILAGFTSSQKVHISYALKNEQIFAQMKIHSYLNTNQLSSVELINEINKKL